MFIKRQMTITHYDFFRILPKALGSNNYIIDGCVITCQDAHCFMRIILSPERRWVVAGLELPVTDVEITINGCDDREANQVLKRFERSFQKGGG